MAASAAGMPIAAPSRTRRIARMPDPASSSVNDRYHGTQRWRDGVRASTAALPGGDLDIGLAVLTGQDEDAAQASPLCCTDIGPHVVADHRDVLPSEIATGF